MNGFHFPASESGLKEPLHLGAKQPAVVLISVVRRYPIVSIFLSRCHHAFQGIRPNRIGGKEPELRPGIVTALWLDHGSDVKDAQPTAFPKAGIARTIPIVTLVVTRKLALDCDVIGKPEAWTCAELNVVDMTRNDFFHNIFIRFHHVSTDANSWSSVPADG
jgi:hypothetical protein